MKFESSVCVGAARVEFPAHDLAVELRFSKSGISECDDALLAAPREADEWRRCADVSAVFGEAVHEWALEGDAAI